MIRNRYTNNTPQEEGGIKGREYIMCTYHMHISYEQNRLFYLPVNTDPIEISNNTTMSPDNKRVFLLEASAATATHTMPWRSSFIVIFPSLFLSILSCRVFNTREMTLEPQFLNAGWLPLTSSLSVMVLACLDMAPVATAFSTPAVEGEGEEEACQGCMICIWEMWYVRTCKKR